MRKIKDTGNEEDRVKVANEAAYLYAPLAHKLGLYKLKSELKRLVAEYTQQETYLLYKGEAQRDESIPRQVYRFSHRSYPEEGKKEAGLKFDIKDVPNPSIPSGIRFEAEDSV